MNIASAIDTGLKAWTGEKANIEARKARAKEVKRQQGIQEKQRQETSRFNALKYEQLQVQVADMQQQATVRKMDSIYTNWMETKNPKLIEQAVNHNPELRMFVGDGKEFRSLTDGDVSILGKQGKNMMHIKNNMDSYVAVVSDNPETGGLQTKYVDFNEVVKGSGWHKRNLVASSKGEKKLNQNELLIKIGDIPKHKRTTGQQAIYEKHMATEAKKKTETTFDKYVRLASAVKQGEKITPEERMFVDLKEEEYTMKQKSSTAPLTARDKRIQSAKTASMITDRYVEAFVKKDFIDGTSKDFKRNIQDYESNMRTLEPATVKEFAKGIQYDITKKYTNLKKGTKFSEQQLKVMHTNSNFAKTDVSKEDATLGKMYDFVSAASSLHRRVGGFQSESGTFAKVKSKLTSLLSNKDWGALSKDKKLSLLQGAYTSSQATFLLKDYISHISGATASDTEVNLLKGALLDNDYAVQKLMQTKLKAFVDFNSNKMKKQINYLYNDNVAPYYAANFHNRLLSLPELKDVTLEEASGERTALSSGVELASQDEGGTSGLSKTADDVYGKALDKGEEIIEKGVEVAKDVAGSSAVEGALDKGEEIIDKGVEVAKDVVTKGEELVDKGVEVAGDVKKYSEEMYATATKAIDKTIEAGNPEQAKKHLDYLKKNSSNFAKEWFDENVKKLEEFANKGTLTAKIKIPDALMTKLNSLDATVTSALNSSSKSDIQAALDRTTAQLASLPKGTNSEVVEALNSMKADLEKAME